MNSSINFSTLHKQENKALCRSVHRAFLLSNNRFKQWFVNSPILFFPPLIIMRISRHTLS